MSILDGAIEYVVPVKWGTKVWLVARDPFATPAEIQARCERDDPIWRRGQPPESRPRFRVARTPYRPGDGFLEAEIE